jgi:hypothetical protein
MLSASTSRRVLAVEIVGTLFIIFLGSALHFTFDWSGRNLAVGTFSATNESVWEHLKLAFWPSLFWMFITAAPLKGKVTNFFAAKAAGTHFMVIFIPIVFYSYTAFTGTSIVPVDLTTFIIAVILGQIISIRLFRARCFPAWIETVGLAVIVLLAVAFVVFTFYPPHLPLFRDPISGGYGI